MGESCTQKIKNRVMAQQSYKVTVEGKAELHNVSCVLEYINVVSMRAVSSTKWEGTINNINVADKLDYRITISAIGRVKFDFTIDNTRVNKQVEKDSGYTNQSVPNGAIVNGNCSAE